VHIDRHLVAVANRSGDLHQLARGGPQAVELGADLILGHLEAGHGDHQPLVAGDGRRRAHGDEGVEGNGPRLVAGGDVDLGLVNGIELGVVHRPGVELGKGLTQGLAPQGGGTPHPGLDHPTRHFPRTEAWHAHVATQPPDHVLECFVDLPFVDLDGQADQVARFGGGGGAHRKGRLYRSTVFPPASGFAGPAARCGHRPQQTSDAVWHQPQQTSSCGIRLWVLWDALRCTCFQKNPSFVSNC
jgi:hypothetical protein